MNNANFSHIYCGTAFGGALKLYRCSGSFYFSNLFFDNTSTLAGGGIYVTRSDGDVEIYNCTFKDSIASFGTGIYIFDYRNAIV